MTDTELLDAFAAADAAAKAAVWPYADGFTHRRLSDEASALRQQCIERRLDWEAVAAKARVINPHGHR